MRKSLFLGIALACIAPLLGAGMCSTTSTNGTTPTTGGLDLGPVLQLAVGDAFTVAQGAAQAYVKTHPTAAAGVQAGLAAAQQAFLAWVNAPAGSTAQQTAQSVLVAANTSLLTSLAAQGVKF